MTKRTMRIAAQMFTQHGRKFYNISITPQLLLFLKSNPPQIKRYDAGKQGKNPSGYQRNQEGGKVEEIGKYMADPANSLIDPINLNVPIESGELEFKPISQANPTLGYLTISEDTMLNIYDGGHRFLGYIRANELAPVFDFEIPATVANRPEAEEAILFTIKNITANRMDSDLLLDIKVMAKQEGLLEKSSETGERRFLPKKLTEGVSWLVDAREITRLLNESRSSDFQENPWYKKLRYPNDTGRGPKKKLPNLQEWFKFGKFAQYLRPVATNSFGLLPTTCENRAIVICNMWKGLRELVPNAFGELAPDYRLATGHVSIEPLHRLVNSFMLYHLHDGNLKGYETFQDAADGVADSEAIPTVSDFVAILKKCKIKDVGGAKARPLFTDAHWRNEGQSRHYHGKGNVSILVGQVEDSLGIPPAKRPVDAA